MVMREDREAESRWKSESPQPAGTGLSWLRTTYQVGEFMLFVLRLCENLKYDGPVSYQIRLHNVAGRVLFADDPGRELRWLYKCAQNEIRIARTSDTVALRADVRAECILILQRIFALFQWTDASEEMLGGDLEKLFARRL
jgi:hypothetical protein